jgi:predicted GNAT family N-acyltransferase
MLNRQLKIETNPILERINIIDAHTENEKQAVYRFRYQVQVQEMRRHIPYADHLRKRIFDELDSWSCLAYAELDGQIVGTVRLTVGSADEFPDELIQAFQLERFAQFEPGRKNIAIGTKLMVAPPYRKTPLFSRLMAKGYEITRSHAVQFCFGGCNPYLIPMYEKMGYRRFTAGFQDPGYGFVIPILLIAEDAEHFRNVRSPFLRIAKKMANSFAARNWFLDNFPDATQYPVGILASEQECWNYVVDRTGDSITNLSTLQKLNQEEARMLLRIATPVKCHDGYQFIRRGDVCNELNILIVGEMTVTNSEGRVFQARPGDTVGSVGLSRQTHHQVDVVAVRDCEILTIAGYTFEKLRRSLPQLADKLHFDNIYEEGR